MSRNIYCLNCGERNHSKRDCKVPVTSYGIILLNIDVKEDMYMVNKLIKNLTIPNINVNMCENATSCQVLIDTEEKLQCFCKIKECIRFLIIKRKHSLGFIEFIRGRYDLYKKDTIIHLFQHMEQKEIDLITQLDFDSLWDNLWGKDWAFKNSEYNSSKIKFNKLKTESGTYNLKYFTDNIKPKWEIPEWGFPKGRRGINESDLKCAMREFMEETGFFEEDFIILNKINPIEEVFFGTDGNKYRHIYYLAISTTDKVPEINFNNKSQSNEIGDICWANFDETLKKIRPYHTQRIRLVTELFMYIINYINNTNIINNKEGVKNENEKNMKDDN